MTPPLPPDGYELVDDEPREADMAWVDGRWFPVGSDLYVYCCEEMYFPARDLRWIARKK